MMKNIISRKVSDAKYTNISNSIPFIIGDVHGCLESLENLLSLIKLESGDTVPIWFTGDIINRGPYSLETLRYIIKLGNRVSIVLGNHEINFLKKVAYVKNNHIDVASDIAFNKIINAYDSDYLINWLRRQPLVLYNENFLLVHAGLLPQWTINETIKLANQIQTKFSSDQWYNFIIDFTTIDNIPLDWKFAYNENLQLSLALCALTRLRFCEKNTGIPIWTNKSGLHAIPDGFVPWFNIPWRRSIEKLIIFGHWSTLGLTKLKNIICLDSGCVWGGALSAIQINQKSEIQYLFQVKSKYCSYSIDKKK